MNNLLDTPAISIVTICRNSATTIYSTIESVLSQNTVGTVQYIIVDGASTDGTQDIVESFGERISCFVSEPDSGISEAFNKGISLARGEIVGLINSDDCLVPDGLAIVERYFQEHPSVDVIHGDVLLYKTGRFVKRLRPARRWWYPWRMIMFNHPATFVRRGVYERYGLFNSEYRIAMDVDIFLRWTRAGIRIDYLPEVLVKMQTGGMSGRMVMQGIGEARIALLSHGFSPVLCHMQYYGKVMLQLGLRCRDILFL